MKNRMFKTKTIAILVYDKLKNSFIKKKRAKKTNNCKHLQK